MPGLDQIVKVLDSQLVSTVLGLVFGSFLIQWFLNRQAHAIDTLRWLITHVEEYEKLSYDYWRVPEEDKIGRMIIAAKLKTEGFFLHKSVSKVAKISKKDVFRIQEEVTELWGAATGGVFESGDRPSDDEIRMTITSVAKAAKVLKSSLYGCLTK